MICWSEKLYFGESIKSKHRKAIYNINHGKPARGIYCIAYASNPENLFDIFAAAELLFPHYKKMEIHIVGLANGREEAELVVQSMLLEIYYKTGAFRVREYFG